MNLQTLVLLSIVFNLSMNTISAVGITPNGTPSVIILNSQVPQISLNSVIIASQCQQSGLTLTCNPIVQLAETFWNVALTFGVFMWGVLQILPILFQAILIPGAYLSAMGIDPTIVNIYSYVFSFLYALWAYTLWTGRYNAEVT
jgi:hypothetical protein